MTIEQTKSKMALLEAGNVDSLHTLEKVDITTEQLLDIIQANLEEGKIVHATVNIDDRKGPEPQVTSIVFQSVLSTGILTDGVGASLKQLSIRFHAQSLLERDTKNSDPYDWQAALHLTSGDWVMDGIPVTLHIKGKSEKDRSTVPLLSFHADPDNINNLRNRPDMIDILKYADKPIIVESKLKQPGDTELTAVIHYGDNQTVEMPALVSCMDSGLSKYRLPNIPLRWHWLDVDMEKCL